MRAIFLISINISNWKHGDRIVILTHPIHWKNADLQKINIYPNPSNEMFRIFIPELESGEIILFKIYDITGKIKINQRIAYTPNIIITHNLERGIYLLKLYYKVNSIGKIKTKKLMIN